VTNEAQSARGSENISFVAADDVVRSHGLDLKPFPPNACAASVQQVCSKAVASKGRDVVSQLGIARDGKSQTNSKPWHCQYWVNIERHVIVSSCQHRGWCEDS